MTTDPRAIRMVVDQIRGALEGYQREELIEILTYVFKTYVVEGGSPLVTGAGVQLDGFYNMKSGDMDFRGHLLLDDKLSQTTTGATSVFLRLVDPFFKRKGGGSSIPIKVTGNYAHPSFGIDLGGNHKGK